MLKGASCRFMEVSYIIENANKLIRVAVIDSGINMSIPELSQCVIASTGFSIDDKGNIFEDSGMKPRHSHGTVVAMSIRHICSSVEFISINILNERLKTNGRVLIHAFRQALSYKPDIINLSLGTTSWQYKLSLWQIVRQAERQNTIVVAAAENRGQKCYPAYIKGVAAVKGDFYEKYSCYGYENGFFYAPCHINGIEALKNFEGAADASGSSISAAYMTGYIALERYKNDYTSVRETMKHIKQCK